MNTLKPGDVEQIITSFNSWYFKREQPSNINLLTKHVEHAVTNLSPIEFTLYWGKGDRNSTGRPEQEALSLLDQLEQRIRNVYGPGVKFTFIFTDTHAELNGYEPEMIELYCVSFREQLTNKNATAVYMSTLCPLNLEGLQARIQDLTIDDELLLQLTEMAQKHYKRDSNFNLAAKTYYLQNQAEKHSVENNYPNSIFLTYNSSSLNEILPTNLPIFYMYSLRKGTSVKPWFQ